MTGYDAFWAWMAKPSVMLLGSSPMGGRIQIAWAAMREAGRRSMDWRSFLAIVGMR